MDSATITVQEFLSASQEFVKISDTICDCWEFKEDYNNPHKSYLKKETFIGHRKDNASCLVKAQYIIFYSLSYGVPAFSFNLWNSSGVLLTLEDIRNMCFIKINKEDFYSVITQQEHPIFCRPYFIMHPCHTSALLTTFRQSSKNIIVTFLSLITPLIPLKLPLEYGM